MTRPKRTTDQQPDSSTTGAPAAGQQAPVRYNALLARNIIPRCLQPYESQAEFDALYQDLRDEFSPKTISDEMYVELIATTLWRLRRISRAHNAVLELEGFTARGLAVASAYQRCEASLMRRILRTYNILWAGQRGRRRACGPTAAAPSPGDPMAP